MIEVTLFGWVVAELASAVSVVLVIVALSSVTYLAMTLAPVLSLAGGPEKQRRTRALGLTVFALALLSAAAGLRVGGAGSGGEVVPTLAIGVVASATFGAGAVLAALGAGAAAARLGAAREQQRELEQGERKRKKKELAAARRAHLEGDDLHAEAAAADAALTRLDEALAALAATGEAVAAKLDALDDAAAVGELGRELRRTRDEVATKLDVGRRIREAAAGAAFRLSCGVPLRKLLRRRPRDLGRAFSTMPADGVEAGAMLAAASSAVDRFLEEAGETRGELAALEERKPPVSEDGDPFEDPWGQALRDLGAIEDAYKAVRDRLGVVGMRLSARDGIDAVARAAGEVSDKARASGIPASDLQELLDEVARAESAIRMATPPELDGHALTGALARGATALAGSDGASLDELLRALREVV